MNIVFFNICEMCNDVWEKRQYCWHCGTKGIKLTKTGEEFVEVLKNLGFVTRDQLDDAVRNLEPASEE